MSSKYTKKNNCNHNYYCKTPSSKHTCLVNGYLTYEDGSPVVNAILILEPINCSSSNIKDLYQFTTTNKYGEYCFLITNTNISYKVKIFDNKGSLGSNCKIIYE